jgi:hypothetical protein
VTTGAKYKLSAVKSNVASSSVLKNAWAFIVYAWVCLV